MENQSPEMKKTPTVAAVGALRKTQSHLKFSAKSTAKAAQHERVLRLLRTGRKSTIELRRAGIIAPAVRIKELKDEFGYDIPTVDRIDMWDDEGFLHPRIAVYELTSEPDGQRA
jgi:hypothetical protein